MKNETLEHLLSTIGPRLTAAAIGVNDARQMIAVAGSHLRPLAEYSIERCDGMTDKIDPNDDYVYALDQASEALAALSCPFYAGMGNRQCASGCYTEPSCEVDTPTGGWEKQLLDAARTIEGIWNGGKLAE